MVKHNRTLQLVLISAALWELPALAVPPSQGLGARLPTMSAVTEGRKSSPQTNDAPAPPIVWTIAGSDSGGGAGIQADLHAIHALGAHGCSVITAMTAQNTHEVTKVEYATVPMIQATIEALSEDLPAKAVKLGMMGTEDVISVVGNFLDGYQGKVICDPVMISTSGSRLMAKGAQDCMKRRIFPRADLITPNLSEAEELLGRKLCNPKDVEEGAAELLATSGARAVLIKGGHFEGGGEDLCQDYWTDGTALACWLTAPRIPGSNTHGTGCTLSSAVAACLALGLEGLNAVVVAKAYVTQGIRAACQLGKGPGPVAQTGWPERADCMPWMTMTAEEAVGDNRPKFLPCHKNWGLYPVVDTAEWVELLLSLGVRDIQLRIKGGTDKEIDAEVARAQAACLAAGAGAGAGVGRLWVNDHCKAALRHGAYGVHLGQEDLGAVGGEALHQIANSGLRLGVSTHSYAELSRALAVRPSYISLGPVFETTSKSVGFPPRGLEGVRAWRALVDVPLITIGGITLENAPQVLSAGSDGLAVIAAITKAEDLEQAVARWLALFEDERL